MRTPLNSVSLGLRILQYEVAKRLGYEDMSPDEVSVRLQEELEETASCNDKNRRDFLDWLDLTQDIQVNAASAVGVLTSLLNYDRIENGNGLSLELSVIDICRLVEQVTAEFRLPAAGKEIQYDVSFYMFNREGERSEVENFCKFNDRKVVGDAIRITQGRYTPVGEDFYWCYQYR